MRRVWALFLALLLSVPAPAVWATPTQFGDSGLISQPSADTHQSGSICVGLWSNYAILKNGTDEKSTFILPFSITLGLGSFIEAYGSYPNLNFNGDEGENITGYPVTGYSDRGFANIGLKMRLLGSRSGPFRFAVDGQARRNLSDDPTVDGMTDYLSRGIMTLKYGKFGLHANGGYLTADTESDADHIVYGGGLEYVPTPRLRFMAEYETSVYDGDDTVLSALESPAEAAFGVQYHLSPHLALSVAYAQGLSDYSPDWRTIIGLYTCQGTGTYIKPITAVPDVEEEEAQAPVAEPVKMLQLNTLAPLAVLQLPAAEGIDPVSEFEVPVKAGEEEIVITPTSDYRIPEGVEHTRDEVDATPAVSPDDDEAIPFTTVMAAATGAAITQVAPLPVAPLPVAPAALTAPQAPMQPISGGRSYALREFAYNGEQIIAQKVDEELAYNTYFLTLEPRGDYLVGEFYHDAAQALPVWIEGPVDYNLSFDQLEPFTLTKLKVRLSAGQVPAFKLHIGARSEVFQFGPPEMWQQKVDVEESEAFEATESVEVAAVNPALQPEAEPEDDGENLALKIGKGILLAPVAVVAAPFAGAAYLAQKATESAATTTASTATGAAGSSTAAAASVGASVLTEGAADTASAAMSDQAAVVTPAAASGAEGSRANEAGSASAPVAGTSAVADSAGSAVAQGGTAAATATASASGAAESAATTASAAGATTSVEAQGAGATMAGSAAAGAQTMTAGAASASSEAAAVAAGAGTTAVTALAGGAGTAATQGATAAATTTASASGAAESAATTASAAGATTSVEAQGAGATMAGSAAAGAQTMTIGAATASSEAAGAAAGAGTTAVTALAGGAGTAATQGATAASNYRSQMATASGGAHAPETQTVLAAVVAPMTASSAEMQSAETLASPMSTSSATMGQDAESLTATTHTSGPIPVAGQTMKTTVYRKYRLPEFTFELGLWDLSDDGRRALSMVMDRLRKLDKWFIVRIDGHTDSTGPASYNETLAMRRAISVASHLVSNEGLNPEVVFLKGFGERKPYESNATMEGRQLNRRIELLVLVPEEN